MPGRFPSVDVEIEIHDGNTEVRLRILDNGVGFSPYSDRRQWAIEAATTELRDQLRSERGENEPFFDRGPGYAQLSGGATSAVYDYV